MPRLRRTRIVDWLVCAAALLAALFFLAVAEFGRRYGTTPESELTVVTGSATEATSSSVGGVTYVRFTIARQTADYASDQPGFDKVIEAIKGGTPMTIGVSTKRETLLPRSGWVALYTLSISGETLLSYADTVSKGYRASNAPYIVGGVLLALSGWGLYTCYRNRNAISMSPEERAALWNDPKRIKVAAVLSSGGIYAAVMIGVLHPDSTAASIKMFGERPLGMPLQLFLAQFVTVLLLPMPIAAWHGFRIIFRNTSEGGGVSRFQIIRALFMTPARHPDLRRSRTIVLSILAFYLVVLFGWALYADAHHI